MNYLSPIPGNSIGAQFRSFQEAIQQSGLNSPPLLPRGQFIRFPGLGKSASNKAGWAILFSDEQAGMFGDFSTGYSAFWKAKAFTPLSEQERVLRRRERQLAQRHIDRERNKAHREAALKAESLWEQSSKPDPHHPYLKKKMTQPHSTRLSGNSIIVPVFQTDASITSLQFISRAGEKRFLKGGKIRGGFCPLGDLTMTDQLFIAEGFATAATLYEQTGTPTVCAFNSGNLTSVAAALSKKYPTKEIVICGDDDRLTPDNPGRMAANQAALVCRGKVMFPIWPPNAPSSLTDFNDLFIWRATQEKAA